jgi:hypothetical protein
MAVQSKKELEKKLTDSIRRSRQVREAAERLKSARATTEGEAIPSTVTLIKPALSPLSKA